MTIVEGRTLSTMVQRLQPVVAVSPHSIPRQSESSAAANWGDPTWEIVGSLATGRWCNTFLARPAGSPAQAAADYVLKAIRSEHAANADVRAMLTQEVRISRQVNHPRIAPILAANLSRAPYYLVMPRIRGATLRAAMERHGRIALNPALWIARQVVEALSVVHRAGWIHADLSPENLIVQGNGTVSVLDFGLSLSTSSEARPEHRWVIGTPAYAAPEMFLPRESRSTAIDSYAVGVMLFQMTTGQLPFVGQDSDTWALAHLREPAPDPRCLQPTLPLRFSYLVKELLAKIPERRPRSDELVHRIAELEIDTFSELDGPS